MLIRFALFLVDVAELGRDAVVWCCGREEGTLSLGGMILDGALLFAPVFHGVHGLFWLFSA